MSNDNFSGIVVLVIGLGLLVGSLFADQLGLGDIPGFGTQQIIGTVIGAVVSAVGLYLLRRARAAAPRQ